MTSGRAWLPLHASVRHQEPRGHPSPASFESISRSGWGSWRVFATSPIDHFLVRPPFLQPCWRRRKVSVSLQVSTSIAPRYRQGGATPRRRQPALFRSGRGLLALTVTQGPCLYGGEQEDLPGAALESRFVPLPLALEASFSARKAGPATLTLLGDSQEKQAGLFPLLQGCLPPFQRLVAPGPPLRRVKWDYRLRESNGASPLGRRCLAAHHWLQDAASA